MTAPSLDIADFRTWLEQQKLDAVIGYPASSSSCPIAEYCKAQLEDQLTTIGVGEGGVHWDDKDGCHDLDPPAWMRTFIRAVDTQYSRIEGIKTAEALQILAEVTS